jgi:glycosyltransferase involved in cell wall biosynthesis
MPVYNTGRYLAPALDSILGQTIIDLELIAVDDASQDGSYGVLERYAAHDPRVRIMRQAHAGTAAALNAGIQLAQSSWIAVHGSDDLSLPGRLERQLEFLAANPDLAALGTWGWRLGSRGRDVSVFDAGPVTRAEFNQLRSDNEAIYLLASSVVLSRDVVLGLGGFRTSAGSAEDIDLWTRIADAHTVLALPERLVRYRIHASSVSTTRFFHQMEDAMRVRENAIRRRSGLAELDYETFHAVLGAQPTRRRVARMLRWRSQYCYRVGGGLLADGRPRGVLWLAFSFALWPGLPAERLKRQLLPWLLEQAADFARRGPPPLGPVARLRVATARPHPGRGAAGVDRPRRVG